MPTSLQHVCNSSTIPYSGQKAEQVDERRDTMKGAKSPVQPLHLRRVRRLVVAFLAIPSLLVFALLHHSSRRRPNVDQIRESGQEHATQRKQGTPSVLLRHDPRETRRCSNTTGKGQGKYGRQCGLHGEVDGEDGGLERGK